jgi:hypothetical protein
MASSNPIHAGNLIENAFFLRPRAIPRPSAGNEQAMAKRLAQLQTALGGTDACAPSQPAPLPTNAPTAPRSDKLSLVLACLISAALGAGAMWLAMPTVSPAMPQPVIQATTETPPVTQPEVQTKVEPAVVASISDERRIEEFVEGWRQAWSARDIAGYLNAYGADFAPADGSRHDDWIASRTRKLAGQAAIEVRLYDLALERLDADHFKVRFRQDYTSGNYREAGRAKTLYLARAGGDWKIVREVQE